MTFADLRALHALIGAAIDDIERVYRPHQRPRSRRPSHSSLHPVPGGNPASPRPGRSSWSTNTTDSDLDESAEADVSTPPTPLSPTFGHTATNNSVRFASSSSKGFRRVRERAHTLSSLPQPPYTPPPGTMPPSILKQPPLDWPSLSVPIQPSSTIAQPAQAITSASPPPAADTLMSPDPSPTTSPRLSDRVLTLEPPHTPISSEGDMSGNLRFSATKDEGPDHTGETPRQKEWKSACEELTSHPEVTNAVNRIVAACGQMSAIVQKPFLTICDAAMGYHLPACLRFLEASHTVEILRDAGPSGIHVEDLARCISSARVFGGEGGVDPSKLSHVLRLLATHHITREVHPDVFANNRISSLMDSGKQWRDLVASSAGGKIGPEMKYEGTDGTAAFVGLCTDELFKAAAYLTDCYLYPVSSPPPSPTKAVFSVEDIDAPLATSSISPVPTIPSILPVPTHTTHSLSEPLPSNLELGIPAPNGSAISLLSPMSRLRKKKSEVGLTINLIHASQPTQDGPMTFAQNPHQSSPTSLFKRVHNRKHSRGPSCANSGGEAPALPPPPPPPTPAKHGILKRLSSRSITPTPDTNKSPSRAPPIPSLPALPPPPNTPRSPMARSMSSNALSTAYNSHATGTPKSTPCRERQRGRSAIDLGDMLSTPKSNTCGGTGEAFNHLTSTPRSAPSKESLRAMTNLNMQLSNIAASRNGLKGSPPTPKSPLATRLRRNISSLSEINGGTSEHEKQHYDGPGQGLLGPAFDLQPPALAVSPRSKTFPDLGHASPGHPKADSHTRVYASPVPPLIPPKSSLRSLRSSASASSTSLASVQERGNGSPDTPISIKTALTEKSKVDSGSEMYAPFNLAFNTRLRYFEWLEKSENLFRLKRFGKAMTGTLGWEVPGSVVSGFPWHELPGRSVVVDVGGGIGSTSMLLASAFPQLRFVVQDRPPVVEMGVAAWRERYPDILDSGRAVFQAHNFFNPQPPIPTGLNCRVPSPESGCASDDDCDATDNLLPVVPSVFLLRVITHDWPDTYVTRILLRLRQAAGPNTKLVLADFVLPLACVDEDERHGFEVVEDCATDVHKSRKKISKSPAGTVRTLAPEGSPLLPNLGKASAVGYWLDLTMRSMFNAQERTLRELTALTLTAGWKIVQVSRADGSLFGHITAVPVDIPPESLLLPPLDAPEDELQAIGQVNGSKKSLNTRTPPVGNTFLAMADLPSDEAIRRSVLWGFKRTKGKKGTDTENHKKRGRERSSTFTGQKPDASNERKGGEVKKGLRTIMRMLSKPQLRGEGAPANGDRQ